MLLLRLPRRVSETEPMVALALSNLPTGVSPAVSGVSCSADSMMVRPPSAATS